MAKILGIDLGTTYSCMAYVNDYGKAEVIMNEEGQPVTPSVVAFEEGDHAYVGEAAKETLSSDPGHVVPFIKRHMGSRDYTFEAFGKIHNPEQISAIILKKLAKDASLFLGETVTDVVITCPAYFGLNEREATKNAGKMARLNVLDVLNEPTAAAISYGMQVDIPQTVMVYDLGGGTFDVTIIKVEPGLIRVVATGGDHKLGGKNWDEAISKYAVQQYCDKTGESSDSIYDDEEEVGDLVLKTETAKKALTTKEKATIKLRNEKIDVTRDLFDQLTVTLLDKTIGMTKETMEAAAKKGITHYDKILLVGGSTWMKQVQDRLNQEFPDIPKEFCDPNQSVAKGAALYGFNISQYNIEIDDNTNGEIKPEPIIDDGKSPVIGGRVIIQNVISHSIAIRLEMEDNQEHIVNRIFRNADIPCEHELHARTRDANQTTVLLEIFEDDMDEEVIPREKEGQCRALVSGEMGPLPPGLPAGEPIGIIFNIDGSGLLQIDAEHKPSGVKKHLQVELKDSLSQKQIDEGTNIVGGIKL